MKTKVLLASSPDALLSALEVLNSGGLVAFPTDTVYGVGALVFDGAAVESIYVAKDRPGEKAIPVLIGDPDDLAKVAREVPEMALAATDDPAEAVRGAVAVARRLAPAQEARAPAEAVRLTPSRALGTVRQAVHWDAANIRRSMDLGARDAQALMARTGASDGRGIFD